MISIRTVGDMAATIARNLHRIDRNAFDVVVGIPRSGMLPASIIATHLQMPLADPAGYSAGIVHGRSGAPVPNGKRVLLVDDSCNKGRAFARAVQLLPRGTRITRLAVFGPYQVDPASVCDIWFEQVGGPRVFAWNWTKHIRLPRWGFDMDGVLCRDCTKAENDDGERYADFLAHVEPLFLPSRPIGHIVTGRAEKYRAQTEAWLARYGVQFEALHMTPWHTKAERMDAMRFAGGRGGWKAAKARELGVEMFIESCPKQAAIIAREAGIPVFCTDTQEAIPC
ncbi:phosphoribosyltransferase family protein [Rhizorhabdus histidinilytica]|uniref:phosphoribosyltransferase family protein n=1 Tax=Rhizorhabdus histidinilytica TaxID=439228 RepID=UPI00321FED65